MESLNELNEFGRKEFGDRFVGCEIIYKGDRAEAIESNLSQS